MKLRVKFSKKGPMKFIGHLDIMRYFQKAVRRSEIDIAYSGGFSPHQIMSFASPLGVGLESTGEYFDIEVNSLTCCEDVRRKLSGEMAEGIEVLAVTELSGDSRNAMASIAAASYTVRMGKGLEKNIDWVNQFEEFYLRDSISVVKKTKKGGTDC